ncbi:nucleoside 2-deoxyribosyltransferase domain-containing protein [Streptomyces sp. NPDC012825]|uniref:nucleoside 2-deoxyribosyltransferase domain-containing protein n=1 Tax=Streptomyces sp. NPDC012825 TaxID=3364851 RepID=UPI0036869895
MNTSAVTLVMARETLPAGGPSVFFAGPTPDKQTPVSSWRPEAVRLLAEQWNGLQPLSVLSPESRHGERAERYEHQVDWETKAREGASATLFWIPRDVKVLPGFTTNVEFGLDAPSGRAVLGAPADCPSPERNRYLIYVAGRFGVPVRTTLADTVAEALALATVAEAPRYSRKGASWRPRRSVGSSGRRGAASTAPTSSTTTSTAPS